VASPELVDAHTHLLLTGPPHYPMAMRDVAALLEQQRSHSISRSIVYSPMEIQRAFRASEDPHAYTRRYNDFIATIQDRHAGEITGVGLVYPFAADESAREAQRIVEELGLHGVMVNPYMRGAWLDQDPRADALLAAVEALGVPLILHPEEDMEREAAKALGRQLRYVEGLVFWRTFATTLVLYGFAAGPLLHRFPRLRLVFAHGGGSFWPSAARVEVLFQELLPAEDPIVAGQWEGDRPSQSPLEWLRSHEVYFDAAWFDGGALRAAVDRFGADSFLFGTDGSAHGHSIGYFSKQLEELGLGPRDLERIRSANAKSVFGIT
jgi:predicted TIM-barrel fold metal-dependent hydrolase